MQTIYVGPDNKVSLNCPICGQEKVIDVTKYLSGNGPVELTYRFTCDDDGCECGHIECVACSQEECGFDNKNVIRLERRRSERKDTRLNGVFQLGKERPRSVWVVDVSRHGVRLEFPPMFDISPGDEGVLDFELDDRQTTAVVKQGKVLRVDNNQAVFLFQDGGNRSLTDKALGHFLVN